MAANFPVMSGGQLVVASLKALADEQLLPTRKVAEAIAKYGIDPDGPNPARS